MMMTQRQAIKAAERKAAKTGRPYYVVWAPEDEDNGGPYGITDEEGLDTYFAGCRVLHCADD